MITQERNECNFPRAKNMYLLVLVVEYFSDQGRVPMTALALEKSCCAESIWQAANKENNAKEGDVGYLILMMLMTSSTMHDNLESPQGREKESNRVDR
jgi:hypothetical protein